MKKSISVLSIIFIILINVTNAQDFSGNYQLQTETGVVSLIFEKDNIGNYSGTLRGNGNVFQLSGAVQDGYLVGNVGEDNSGIVFQAGINNDYLSMTLMEMYSDGTPNLNTAQNMIFEIKSGRKDQQEMLVKDGNIVINNVTLTQEQIQEIEETYGVKPLPGNYWYDSRSGLYGVVGYPAYGFMYPGHKYGVMDKYASGGNTGVVINGRELSQEEWTVWSITIQYAIQPGYYWMDEQGNAGYEGADVPLVNLYVAAQQGGGGSGGQGGDNIWSSRFGAGNYDSGNQRGYVSVPGHGPVGYGF